MKGHTNNPNGRPKKAEVKDRISIRLSNDAMQWINRESEKRKIPKGMVIENLIAGQMEGEP